MGWMVSKYLLSAALVVAVSELARHSGRLGGLIAALPLVTLLALLWMQLEGEPPERLAETARYTVWYVLPSLPMLYAFGHWLPRLGFWPALLLSGAVAALAFALLVPIARRLGVGLL